MNKHNDGPLRHVIREFAAGNPGTQYLIGEVLEAHERLREYEGMMTRREVLEAIARHSATIRRCPPRSFERQEKDMEYQLALLNVLRIHEPLTPIWGGFTKMSDGTWARTRVTEAAHELALLMNAEREEAQG